MQVIKDPIGTKGARLSTQISIAGRMLVYLPQDNHIGISQKIGSHELREQLRARMVALAGTDGGGFILRTNAEDATDQELGDDIAYLRKAWTTIRELGFASPPGTLLHQDLSLAERVLRDLANDDTHAIRIDSKLQYEHLRGFGTAYTPSALAYGDYVYLLTDGGLVTCIDIRTGEVKYEGGRPPRPARVWSSLVAYDDRIFLTNEDGETHVIRAGPTFQIERTNAIGEPVYASLAPVGGRVYIRTHAHLFAIAPK